MDIKDAYLNLIDRATANLERVPVLSPAQLNTHPGGHPNSAAWNLWHAGRAYPPKHVVSLACRFAPTRSCPLPPSPAARRRTLS